MTIKCAIYTRKSTDEGLDKEFNTLNAQRESGENYVKSQMSQGWELLQRVMMMVDFREEHWKDQG